MEKNIVNNNFKIYFICFERNNSNFINEFLLNQLKLKIFFFFSYILIPFILWLIYPHGNQNKYIFFISPMIIILFIEFVNFFIQLKLFKIHLLKKIKFYLIQNDMFYKEIFKGYIIILFFLFLYTFFYFYIDDIFKLYFFFFSFYYTLITFFFNRLIKKENLIINGYELVKLKILARHNRDRKFFKKFNLLFKLDLKKEINFQLELKKIVKKASIFFLLYLMFYSIILYWFFNVNFINIFIFLFIYSFIFRFILNEKFKLLPLV